MRKNKTSYNTRVIALLLITALVLSVSPNALAEEIIQPRASYYLTAYNAYVYIAGGGEVRVYFNVSGTGYMDELGALSIEIYECDTNSPDQGDWIWKETFLHDSTSGMLSYNDDFHSGYVTYDGTAGKYYRAYVCIWGGKDGDGDTRYFWTSARNS